MGTYVEGMGLGAQVAGKVPAAAEVVDIEVQANWTTWPGSFVLQAGSMMGLQGTCKTLPPCPRDYPSLHEWLLHHLL